MRSRQIESQICEDRFLKKTVLLCSEATPEHCHRRLVLEYLQREWGGIQVIHL
jgi:uncharacterized protein (DUF488 family)